MPLEALKLQESLSMYNLKSITIFKDVLQVSDVFEHSQSYFPFGLLLQLQSRSYEFSFEKDEWRERFKQGFWLYKEYKEKLKIHQSSYTYPAQKLPQWTPKGQTHDAKQVVKRFEEVELKRAEKELEGNKRQQIKIKGDKSFARIKESEMPEDLKKPKSIHQRGFSANLNVAYDFDEDEDREVIQF